MIKNKTVNNLMLLLIVNYALLYLYEVFGMRGFQIKNTIIFIVVCALIYIVRYGYKFPLYILLVNSVFNIYTIIALIPQLGEAPNFDLWIALLTIETLIKVIVVMYLLLSKNAKSYFEEKKIEA